MLERRLLWAPTPANALSLLVPSPSRMSFSDNLLAWNPAARRPAGRWIPHESVQFGLTGNDVIATSAVGRGGPHPPAAPFAQLPAPTAREVRSCSCWCCWVFLFFSFLNTHKSPKFMKRKIKPRMEATESKEGGTVTRVSRGNEGRRPLPTAPHPAAPQPRLTCLLRLPLLCQELFPEILTFFSLMDFFFFFFLHSFRCSKISH